MQITPEETPTPHADPGKPSSDLWRYIYGVIFIAWRRSLCSCSFPDISRLVIRRRNLLWKLRQAVMGVLFQPPDFPLHQLPNMLAVWPRCLCHAMRLRCPPYVDGARYRVSGACVWLCVHPKWRLRAQGMSLWSELSRCRAVLRLKLLPQR